MSEMVQDYQVLEKGISFSKAYPSTGISAIYKYLPEDFVVEENVTIDLSGDGEHCWLFIQKKNCNTDWLAQKLARFCEIKPMAVSYAGLKDRHALTSQWFSVHLPGKATPDWNEFEQAFASDADNHSDSKHDEAEIKILKSTRHNRKLKRGALQGNRFRIRMRQLSDTSDSAFQSLHDRCEQVRQKGVPNYFGTQRFGRNNSNLEQASRLFSRPRNRVSRHKRGIYLSAARSWMFNHILSQRVDNNIWDTRLPGDVFMLDRKSACFVDENETSEELVNRLTANQIHPTAALWGEGDPMVTSQAKELEEEVIGSFPVYRDGLLKARVQSMRRACRVIPGEMRCQRTGDDFELVFELPSGSYATSVLSEFFSELNVSA